MGHLASSIAGMARRPLRHAIVLGGSVAGLLAARVLSDHFERVTLIERDELMRRPEPRKGVPQGNHLHALLARGRMTAEALLPGLSDELLAAGAFRLNGGGGPRGPLRGGRALPPRQRLFLPFHAPPPPQEPDREGGSPPPECRGPRGSRGGGFAQCGQRAPGR